MVFLNQTIYRSVPLMHYMNFIQRSFTFQRSFKDLRTTKMVTDMGLNYTSNKKEEKGQVHTHKMNI